MSQTSWEADKMLDVYIYDYLVKRKLHASAKAFQAEGKVSTDPVAINAPGGFLFEWWSVFWDIFIARTNDKHSEVAATYIEAQFAKVRELQQQQQQGQQHPKSQTQPAQQQQQQQHQQLQMQQMLYQRHAQQQQQQQRRDGNQLLNTSNDALMRQNPATANAMAAKMYEERLKLPLQRDSFDDAAMKLLDPNHASMSKSPAVGGQSPRQTLHGAPAGMAGNIQQVQNRNQQLPLSTQDIKSEVNSMLSPRAVGREGSIVGAHGSSQGGNSLTLKGWPLTGLDQLRSGLLQQKSLMQSPQPFNQLQLQQQLMLQAQQNLTSPSVNDLESRRLRMLLNSPNVGSPMQLPVLPRGDTDMLLKLQQQQLQNSNQQQQQYMQHPLSSQQSRSSNPQHQQQDKLTASGGMTGDGSMSNTYRGNEQAPKSQVGRKRKQALSSSGPANSSGTANTAGGPCASSPSSPSTHTPGDVISMPTMPHNSGASSKSLLMFGSDGLEGSLASAPNQLADMDRLVDDGALEDTVESYLSHDYSDPRDRVCQPFSPGFTFTEVQVLPASTSKVECCHFSSDGSLLVTGGHDKKAVIWCTRSFSAKSTLEEHGQWITDVRFSPSMSRLATSSADKTVRVWDADNPGYSLRTFTGHSSTVTSVDFHPNNEDLICSSDNNSEIRYWSIKNGSCAGVLKGGATQLRFQPRLGKFLAAASENFVSIFDVDAQVCRHKLQGHKNKVQSICWHPYGDTLASVSDDMIRVWAFGNGECMHVLRWSSCKFHSCVFHPSYRTVLVIGCHETLELWNMIEDKRMTVRAHDKVISALAANSKGLIASASHDKFVKLWI